MDDLQKMFLKQLEEDQQQSPILKLRFAGFECIHILNRACTNEQNQVGGDLVLYHLATLAGVACFKAAVNKELQSVLGQNGEDGSSPLMKAETDMGAFYFGASINKYLLTDELSVWNLISGAHKKNHQGVKLPDIEAIVKYSAKNVGNPNYRIWDDIHNPYEEKEGVGKLYDILEKQLEPYKITVDEMPVMYAMAILEMLPKVEKMFPLHLNPYEMVMETVVFNAHMEYM